MSDSELFLKSKIAVRFHMLLSGLVYDIIAHSLFNVPNAWAGCEKLGDVSYITASLLY